MGLPNKDAEVNNQAVVGKTILIFFDLILDSKSIVRFVD